MNTNDNAVEPNDDLLGELVEELESVDEQSPKAKLNATTISDNNGRVIELGGMRPQMQRPVQGMFATDRTFTKIDRTNNQDKGY
jgi:hypothetical protein